MSGAATTFTVLAEHHYAACTSSFVTPNARRKWRTFTTWSSVRSRERVEPNDVVSPSMVTAQLPRCVSYTSPKRPSSEQTSCH